MQSWLIYGLIASLCFGVNAIIYKVAATKGQGLNPFQGALSAGIGVILFFIIVYFVKSSGFTPNWTGVSLAILAGIIWAIGFLAIALAIANKGDIAKLAPIYNTNTLIAVILGIIFLKEIPQGAAIIKVISGAILIVIGSVLVSS